MKAKKARKILLEKAEGIYFQEIYEIEDLIASKANEGKTELYINSDKTFYQAFFESNHLSSYFKIKGYSVKVKDADSDEKMHIVISWAK